ncbi:molybdenum cofactor guanylyltransferase [uncultured Dysosmobacter sp.]|uniref:molybdenum cofactor guanylyltransferase n=1 Tax=uncultured Dysosmobacter sp. TaxID=2591384 RepID=UPI002639993A|nr:molybdenum cofactor guanylyltransferase [uncultured Dysosmobacter sp.]
MAISAKNCGAMILAGGQSRRMGRCKALLELDGETLISRLAKQLDGFGELLLSANDPQVAAGIPGRLVTDIYPGLGPLAGLHAALTAAKVENLLCVSCDMPYFTAALAEALLNAFPPDTDALACVDGNGRVHPLCGIYAKTALPVIERRLQNRQLKMLDLLAELCTVYFPIPDRFPAKILTNVNTPEAFAGVKGDFL